MTPSEIIAIIGAVISLLSVIAGVSFSLYIVNRNNDTDDLQHEQRLTALETKVGLFWHLVEENMSSALAKSNPIHLELDEQAAATIYDAYKSKSPTPVLLKLSAALERELKKKYFSSDEALVFTLLLGAIRSQLYDRGYKVHDPTN